MRIRVWNAYASNNSGSYTIVGSLPSVEVAFAVADELKALIEAHTAWYASSNFGEGVDGSPLAEFCRQNGLTLSGPGFTEWPQYSDDNRPRVVVVGRQIIVHHPYTASMPPSFGELFYKRGGRVDHEEDHAHYPLVVVASYWWGWSKEDQERMHAERPLLLAALTDGVLAETSPHQFAPAWQIAGERFGEAPLAVGAIFVDLIEGVQKLRAAGELHGAHMMVRIFESLSDEHDPLSHLRPSSPAVPRFDVVVQSVGADSPSLMTALYESVGLYEGDARRRLVELPCAVGRSLSRERAEPIAERLRQAGATVELIRNDG